MDDENTVDTLINRIKKYLYQKGEYDPMSESSFAPSLCNRLDRNTQGNSNLRQECREPKNT